MYWRTRQTTCPSLKIPIRVRLRQPPRSQGIRFWHSYYWMEPTGTNSAKCATLSPINSPKKLTPIRRQLRIWSSSSTTSRQQGSSRPRDTRKKRWHSWSMPSNNAAAVVKDQLQRPSGMRQGSRRKRIESPRLSVSTASRRVTTRVTEGPKRKRTIGRGEQWNGN